LSSWQSGLQLHGHLPRSVSPLLPPPISFVCFAGRQWWWVASGSGSAGYRPTCRGVRVAGTSLQQLWRDQNSNNLPISPHASDLRR
jgi:hypothetical protein